MIEPPRLFTLVLVTSLAISTTAAPRRPAVAPPANPAPAVTLTYAFRPGDALG